MRNTIFFFHSPKWQKEQVSAKLLIAGAPQFGWGFFAQYSPPTKFEWEPTTKTFPPALWTLRNVQTRGKLVCGLHLCDRERSTWLLQKENASDTWQGHPASLCQRESLPQLHSWRSSLHPAWDKTLLPPSTDTSVSLASAFLILLKHNLVFLFIKSTTVAAAGSKRSHSQRCPFLPSFYKP